MVQDVPKQVVDLFGRVKGKRWKIIGQTKVVSIHTQPGDTVRLFVDVKKANGKPAPAAKLLMAKSVSEYLHVRRLVSVIIDETLLELELGLE